MGGIGDESVGAKGERFDEVVGREICLCQAVVGKEKCKRYGEPGLGSHAQ